MRTGFTVIQIVVTVGWLGMLTGVTAPRFVRYRDRLEVHAAAMDVVSSLGRARALAFERSTRVATTFDVPTARLAVHSYGDTVEVRPLAALYGISLSATRDSVTYAANAMGYGASNTRIIVARGAVAETITVSRLGRVRH